MYKALLILLITLLGHGVAKAQDPIATARNYRDAHGHEILSFFGELLRIPNTAFDLPNIERNASFLKSAFEARGVRMELLTLPDAPPIVFGELKVPGAKRTLMIYVHYDGQPVAYDQWESGSPWSGELYTDAREKGGQKRSFPEAGEKIDPKWRIYGRSASDDKAPFPALLAVLDAFREAGIQPSSNLKFFFEGEEEASSPNIGAYYETYKDKLSADAWIVLDGPVHQSGRPQIVYGVRGTAALDITVYGAVRSLHSGHYGNFSPVPGQMLVHLLASMKDERGQVLIDGFYDSTTPITEADKLAIAAMPDYDDEIRRELGISWSEGENALLAERLLYPSLTIQGITSGNTGKLARNVIPSTASANIGMRLAKGNDPEEMMDKVEAHIRKQGYHLVRSEPDMDTRLQHDKIALVHRRGGYPASRTPIDLPISETIIAAIKRIDDRGPVLVPTYGASLPVFHFTRNSEVPLLIIPIANFDNNQHAPDENLRIGNLWFGIELYAALFTMP